MAKTTRFTPHLKPLESLKNDFMLLENLWNKNTVGRNGHWPKVPAWLSGGYVERTTATTWIPAAPIGGPIGGATYRINTPLPTFELGLETPRTGIDIAGGGFARMYGSFHLLARSAYACSQGDRSTTGFRPAVSQ